MIAAASRRRCLEVKPCRSQSPRDQSTVPFQVVLVDISVAVPRAVVLVDPPSPVDPQVDPGDEAAPLVEDLLLRGHRNLSRLMQHSHDRFPRGLAPCIKHRNDPSQ